MRKIRFGGHTQALLRNFVHSKVIHSSIATLEGLLADDATRRTFIRALLCLPAVARMASARDYSGATVHNQELVRDIPQRASHYLGGSEFANCVSQMDPQQREQAIRDEILKGNVPEFLRKLVPVELSCGLANGGCLAATIFVAPDYLAIGSDVDFLRIPMNLHTAIAVTERFQFILPTKKMVDAIYLQSRCHLIPQPLPAGPEMRSTEYYRMHNRMIEKQARTLGMRLGELVSGGKKDVVITNLLFHKVGRIAIYGWHRGPGEPIQPLSTVHGANYADYSHGIRLVSETALIGGKPQSIYDILRDSYESRVLSDEGPIRDIREFLSQQLDCSHTTVAASN